MQRCAAAPRQRRVRRGDMHVEVSRHMHVGHNEVMSITHSVEERTNLGVRLNGAQAVGHREVAVLELQRVGEDELH